MNNIAKEVKIAIWAIPVVLLFLVCMSCNTCKPKMKPVNPKVFTGNHTMFYSQQWDKNMCLGLIKCSTIVTVPNTSWWCNATNNDITYYLSNDLSVELKVRGNELLSVSIADSTLKSGVEYYFREEDE